MSVLHYVGECTTLKKVELFNCSIVVKSIVEVGADFFPQRILEVRTNINLVVVIGVRLTRLMLCWMICF